MVRVYSVQLRIRANTTLAPTEYKNTNALQNPHRKRMNFQKRRSYTICMQTTPALTVFKHPEAVKHHVLDDQEESKNKSTELSLVTDGHKKNQNTTDDSEQDARGGLLAVHKSHKHKNKKNTSKQLKVVLARLRGVHFGDAGKTMLVIFCVVGNEENKPTDKSKTPEEEVDIPQDTVRHGLHDDDACENHRGIHSFLLQQNRAACNQLGNKVENDEHASEESDTAKLAGHKIHLVSPLKVHAEPVINKSGNNKGSTNFRDSLLGVPKEILGEIFGVSNIFAKLRAASGVVQRDAHFWGYV
eukprot:Colp12_sorted_trinity150504_noHs@18826